MSRQCDDEELTVTIGAREIYDKLVEVSDAVRPLPAKVEDHENRIRALERARWIAAGAASLFGGSVALVVDLIFRIKGS